MKKTLLLVLSIICLSCAKNGSQPETLSLNVASESVTKVSLGNDYVTTWNTGDCATVFYRSLLATEWNYVGDDGALCGQLRYVGEPMHNTTDEIVAVVPADDQATLASGVLKTAVASVQKGFAPILLLDEVTTHLDNIKKDALLYKIKDLKLQAWITSTESQLFEILKNDAQFFNVKNNQVF